MAIGKRLRFEILKRDGFRCRYCGANAAGTLLHVDHVVPVAEGGSDDPENLVAACGDCNLGKSSVTLDISGLECPEPTDAMLEHADQMRAYLAAVQERERAKNALVQAVIDKWMALVDQSGMQVQLINQLSYWIEQIGLERVLASVDAVAGAHHLRYSESQRKYFIAVMRNTRDGKGGV